MTLDQLRVFAKVAETLNMRQAAETLHLSQPAISAAIAALEGRYAVRLFDRIGRRLELTAAGRAFLAEAQALVTQSDITRRVLEDLAGLIRGELRIFASQTVATYWLPPRMARFAKEYPQISLCLSVGNTTNAVDAIVAGEADLGFVEGVVVDTSLRQEKIGGDHLSLYVASGHSLIGRRIIARDLKSASWVLRERGSGTREHFATSLNRFGISMADLDVRLELPSNGAVLEAVAIGGLVTAVSDLAAAARSDTGTICRLECDMPGRDFRLLIHRQRHLSRAATAFIQLMGVADQLH